MTRSATSLQLGHEFDAFLYTSIGGDGNGKLLSVLSALARQEIDPWQEAAELARMPREAASRRMTSLIAAIPDASSAGPQPEKVASRLIALLPGGTGPSVVSSEKLTSASGLLSSQLFFIVILINLLISVLVQGPSGQSLPEAKLDSAHAPASSTVVPQKSLSD